MGRLSDALALNIDDDSAGGVVEKLYQSLRAALLAGRFAPGTKMPSTRLLAVDVGVSRNTAMEVYERLIGESCLVGRAGSGTYVSDSLRAQPRRRAHTPAASTASNAPTANTLISAPLVSKAPTPTTRRLPPVPAPAWREAAGAPAPMDFRLGQPDAAAFPSAEWRKSEARVMRSSNLVLMDELAAEGNLALRQQLAQYLAASRGLAPDPHTMVITAGAQQAFSLLGRVLFRRSDVVAVEEPGYPPAIVAFEGAGARVVGVPVDRHGIVVSKLPSQAVAVCVTPSHQFPLGMTMSLRRRQELLEWARQNDAWIIEDDYDSEYRFASRRLEALKAIDEDDRVVYVGTLSKMLSPAFRLGFAVLPRALAEPFSSAKWLADRFTSSWTQAVLADFMARGAFALHIRRMQKIYAERFQRMRDGLAAVDKRVGRLLPSEAGMHMTMTLHDDIYTTALIARAAAQGVGLHDLATFSRRPDTKGIVLGFGNIANADIGPGLAVVARLLNATKKG